MICCHYLLRNDGIGGGSLSQPRAKPGWSGRLCQRGTRDSASRGEDTVPARELTGADVRMSYRDPPRSSTAVSSKRVPPAALSVRPISNPCASALAPKGAMTLDSVDSRYSATQNWDPVSRGCQRHDATGSVADWVPTT